MDGVAEDLVRFIATLKLRVDTCKGALNAEDGNPSSSPRGLLYAHCVEDRAPVALSGILPLGLDLIVWDMGLNDVGECLTALARPFCVSPYRNMLSRMLQAFFPEV